MHPKTIARMSYVEYVALETSSDVRHEFLEGEVFAMAGGTPEHAALAAAIIGELRTALRGRPCRVYSSDARVRVRETGLATYPDVTVVFGRLETDVEDPDAITNPVLLVEVLSESTEAYDRGTKAAHYRKLASLREYVLVCQDERRIEVFRRTEHDRWELTEARPGKHAELESLGVSLDVSLIYENSLPPAEPTRTEAG